MRKLLKVIAENSFSFCFNFKQSEFPSLDNIRKNFPMLIPDFKFM